MTLSHLGELFLGHIVDITGRQGEIYIMFEFSMKQIIDWNLILSPIDRDEHV